LLLAADGFRFRTGNQFAVDQYAMTFASAFEAFDAGSYPGAMTMLARDGEATIVHRRFSAYATLTIPAMP
jgi:hypothetical protein